ncbi:MAG: 54S ribosomal protein, mitochondrial [Vezdaea acicularis]|nr:MAG: 54S ribosomal protein, mitochondrial [Vezdaea acicularis]
MSPLAFHPYSANHLQMPLRRDILHRAVIYEGDNTRQGTASTKWRSEVHGSNAKIRPQKGTGRARLGDKKSPMLRGGGVAFGPKPRDHSTDLPRKIYDMAWRTALSYRFNKGELVVVDQLILDHEQPGYLEQILARNHWGNADGRSLMVAISEKDGRENLFAAMGKLGQHGNALSQDDVDVKDLLEMGRVIIEKAALDRILQNHSSDLDARVPSAVKS